MNKIFLNKSFVLLTAMLLLVGGFFVSVPLVHAETSVANQAELIAALADVNAAVITLSDNITLTSTLNVGRTVTINGAGFTLTRTTAPSDNFESYAIMVSSGTLTASNLKIVSNNTGTGNAVGITVQSGASLSLSGSTITAAAAYGLVYGVYAQPGATAVTLSNNSFIFSGADTTTHAHRIMLGMTGMGTAVSLTSNIITSTLHPDQEEIKLAVCADGVADGCGTGTGKTLAEIKAFAETGNKVSVGEKLRATASDATTRAIYTRTATGWTTPVTDQTELLAALAGSSDIVLSNDITLTSTLNVGRTVTINGAGFTLTRTTAPSDNFESYAIMVSSGTLTASNLKIVSNNTGTGNAVGITVQSGASLSLSGSTITAAAAYGLVYGVYAQPGATAVTLSNNSFIFSGADTTTHAHRIMLGMTGMGTAVSLTSNIITSTLHPDQEEIKLAVCADGVADGCGTGTGKTLAQIQGYAAMGDKVAIGEKLRATASDALTRTIYTRPATGWDTPIEAIAIAGVTPPVTGAIPVTTVTAGTGYTGTVTWSGSPSTFAGGTVYTATITLTAATGYTLTGVTTDQFTIAGSTSDTNSANAGVITAVFPATASASHGGGGGSTTPPVTPITCTLPQVRNASTNTCVTPTVTCTLPLVLNASANACVTSVVAPEGCSGGNLFNTSTGAACINNAEPQGCSGGNKFNTSTGAACVNNVEIPGCGNKTTGFSTASGLSCVNNRVTPDENQGQNSSIHSGPYNFGTTTLKNGSKGEGVKELQRFLNAKLKLGLVIDGKLGPKTIAVIKKWQKANGLVADGLVGAKTKAKMHSME